MNQIIKNIAASTFILVASSKIISFLNNKIKYKYPFISSYVLPVGWIGSLYASKLIIDSVNVLPINFLNFMLSSYLNFTTFSYYLSIMTLIIGYPSISLLITIGKNKLRKYVPDLNNILIGDKKLKDIVDELINIGIKMKETLERNENWDIIWNGVSFKTFETPKKIINSEELNKIVPLRCANDNPSTSKFIENCSICLEDIEVKKLHRELPCLHVFHPECVDNWLLKCDAVCPTCREKVYTEIEKN